MYIYYYAPRELVFKIIESKRLEGVKVKEKEIYYGAEVYLTEMEPVTCKQELPFNSGASLKQRHYELSSPNTYWQVMKDEVRKAPNSSDFFFRFDTERIPGFLRCPSRDYEGRKAWVYTSNLHFGKIPFDFGEVGSDEMLSIS